MGSGERFLFLPLGGGGGEGERIHQIFGREKERPFENFSHPVFMGLIFFVCKIAKRSQRNVTLLPLPQDVQRRRAFFRSLCISCLCLFFVARLTKINK